MLYEEAKKQRETINTSLEEYEKEINKYEKGYMGLPSEQVRMSTEYRELAKKLNSKMLELQNFNKWFVKTFKKEIQKEQRERRKRK